MEVVVIIYISIVSRVPFQHIDVDSKQWRWIGATLFNPNGAPDKIKKASVCTKMLNHCYTTPHGNHDEGLENTVTYNLWKRNAHGTQ